MTLRATIGSFTNPRTSEKAGRQKTDIFAPIKSGEFKHGDNKRGDERYPKHLIELIPYDATTVVACSSKDKGKDVMKACSVGCIGCHLCEKNCEHDAIHVVDNVAYVDQEKCTGCGKCAEKCPKKIILSK